MIILKIIVALSCSWCFWAGGNFQHNYRRFLMPLLLTATCLLLTHFDIRSLTMIGSIGFLCLGYGDKSPLRHCFGNGWGRGIWGLFVGVALSLGLFLSGYILWYFFFGYLALSFILENALKNINQNIGDLIIGLGFSSILFLIH